MKTLGRLLKKRTSTNKWKVAKPRGNTSVVDISRPLDVAIEDEYVQQACTILLLPDEVTLHILQYLPGSSLPRVALACRQYYWLVKDMLGTQKLAAFSIDQFDIEGREFGFSDIADIYKATHLASGKTCVIKEYKKNSTTEVSVRRTMKAISAMPINPYVMRYQAAFQTDSTVYFVGDLVEGKDIASVLDTQARFSESAVRFWFSEMICGLEYLHRAMIYLPDITLGDIILDTEGHIRIIDHQLAPTPSPKFTIWEKEGACPSSIPEEIFSLGCVIYELLVGLPPFSTPDDPAVDEKSTTAEFKCPTSISDPAEDLLSRMLCSDPQKRITLEAVKRHSFFSGVNWQEVKRKRLVNWVPKPETHQEFWPDIYNDIWQEPEEGEGRMRDPTYWACVKHFNDFPWSMGFS